MASKAIGFLNFKFGADLGGFEKAMNKAQKKLKKFGKSVEKTGKNLTTSLTLPIVGLGVASIKAFDEQEKAIAQVEAGLKSTGNTVGFTSEKLQKMAADLQKTTLFGDEEILKGATAQLLTFTNITGEQFKKTQEVALDLATRLDGDLKGASIMLGKALNDPVANLSALSRAGIQFSEEQKATVKAMVATNDLAGAQTLILAELEKQYGGSAEAAALAGMGPITQLTNQLSDLSEQIGERLIPFVKQFTDWIVGLAEKFDGLSESQKDNIVKWGLILAAIGPVLFIIGKLFIAFSSLIGILKTVGSFLLANPYIALAVGIGVVVVALTDWADGLFGVSEAQKAVNDINDMASKAIIGQKVEVDLLTTALKDENATLEDKETALNSLNTIAPEYYGKLNAATLDVKALDTATKNYTDSILQQAIAEASMTKLKELNSQLLEFELSGVKKGSKMYNLFTADIQNQITAVMDLINANKKLESSTDKVVKTEIAEEIDLKIPTKKITTTKITKEIEKTTKSFEDFQSSIDDTALVWDTYAHSISNAEDQFAGIVFWQTELTDNQKLLNAGMGMFGDVLTSSLDSALNSQENFFDVFIKNIKKAITSLLIQLAVMSLINMMMGGGAAAFSISSLKTNLSSLIGVPAFAEGGLVTGPTTALIGEGVGTNAGNPEVVAPLDKLKSMMGGGNNSNITVTGKLIGSDIFLSNQNASNNRLRTT